MKAIRARAAGWKPSGMPIGMCVWEWALSIGCARCIEADGFQVLAKPYRLDELNAALARAFQVRRD